jgi:hypothetical protein
MKKLLGSTAARAVALTTVLALSMVSLQSTPATGEGARSGATERTVAQTKAGELKSRIVGTTSQGRKVTGSFVPLRFIERNGKLMVRGLVQGVVHEKNGDRTTFATMKTMRVASIAGAPVTGRTAAATERATCDILNLVLGPLDLDLLGLKVHLDRVVLNIVAETGAGNLLGNLLCAVTGLLDGGPLAGLLGQLSDLLNQILGRLRLG